MLRLPQIILFLLVNFILFAVGDFNCFTPQPKVNCNDECIVECVANKQKLCLETGWTQECVEFAKLCTSECSLFVFKQGPGAANDSQVSSSNIATDDTSTSTGPVTSGTLASSIFPSGTMLSGPQTQSTNSLSTEPLTTNQITSSRLSTGPTGATITTSPLSGTTTGTITTSNSVFTNTAVPSTTGVTTAANTAVPITTGVTTAANTAVPSTTGVTTAASTTNNENGGIQSSSGDSGNDANGTGGDTNVPLVLGVALAIGGLGLCISAGFFVAAAIRRRRVLKESSEEEEGEDGTELETSYKTSVPTVDVEITPADKVIQSKGYASQDTSASKPVVKGYSALSGSSLIEESADTTARQKDLLDKRQMSLEIAYGELEIDRKVGEGAFGVVYKANWRGSPVAVKQLTAKMNSTQESQFEREISLMKNLRPHRNVLNLFGYCSSPLAIVTEYCADGSLHQLLQSKAKISESQLLQFARGICAGMTHLHYENVIHRDLAARNILINQGEVKVADFGMSRFIENTTENNATQNTVGPLRWMSPESLNDKVYSNKTDVWSFGCILYEMLERKEPYPGLDLMQVAIKVAKGDVLLFNFLTSPDKHPAILVQLLKDCMKFNPSERPEFKDALKLIPS